MPVALVRTCKEMENTIVADQYENERNTSLLDMTNLIYVAFTRPVERLYILTRNVQKSGGEPKTIYNYLTEFIKNDPEKWTQNGYTFTRGDNKPVKKEFKAQPQDTLLKNMISSHWQDRIRIARRAPMYWTTDPMHDKIAWGTLLHDALAAIKSENDIEDVIADFVFSRQLNEEVIGKLRQALVATVSHEKLAAYFKPDIQIKQESAILLQGGEVFRPDRVVLLENETVIIEYKTGMPEQSHREQLDNYAKILGQMGYREIKKMLVYIDDKIKVVMG